MIVIWEGFHDGDPLIRIRFIYDDEDNEYEIQLTQGFNQLTETFKPYKVPENDIMNIKDLEKAVKISNNLLKKLVKMSKK